MSESVVSSKRRANGGKTPRPLGRRLKKALGGLWPQVLLFVIAVPMVLPFYWMIATSLKTAEEVVLTPPVWWPAVLQWGNFVDALTFRDFPFLLYLRNSLFYAGSVVIGSVLSCALVGYSFARLRFPGRDLLFIVTLGTMMIPSTITFIPTYVLFKRLGMVGSYAPLIIPSFGGSAFFIFMLRQFFLGLPWELSESAKVDGAGEVRIFWEIMLPLVRSPLMVVAVFTFLWTWNDYFGPLIYVTNHRLYPVSVGLTMYRTAYRYLWELTMAASAVTTIPVVILFFFTQQYFLEGITMTGIKG